MDNCPSILKKNLRGMSITEILIVVTLLSIIAVVLISAFKPSLQFAKARDSRRKADLQKLKNPLEDYYNDNKCYPTQDKMTCDPGTGLRPYKDKIPCDPETGESYYYEFVDCNTYRIYVNLENESDPAIAEAGCTNLCGPSPYYNWGISSPNTNLVAKVEECTGPGDVWWSCQDGQCNSFENKPAGAAYCNDSSCGGIPCP